MTPGSSSLVLHRFLPSKSGNQRRGSFYPLRSTEGCYLGFTGGCLSSNIYPSLNMFHISSASSYTFYQSNCWSILQFPISNTLAPRCCFLYPVMNEKQHLCLSAMKEVPGGAEVSQWFGDDSSLEAFLYKALQHRIGVWHIQVNVWDFTVNPFIALQCQDSNNHWVIL